MDRDFLFGILAVQLGLTRSDAVMAAGSAWLADKTMSIPDRLVAVGAISAQQRAMLDGLVAEAIKVHGGDVKRTLDSLGGERMLLTSFGGGISLDSAGKVSVTPETGSGEDSFGDTTTVVPEFPGRYRVSEDAEIGRGGIGRVLIAFDECLGREVAVKELLAGAASSVATTPKSDGVSRTSAIAARFLREARVTGQLEHPNIVPVYEVGQRQGGSYYYTMKLVRGRTLAAALVTCKSLADRLGLLHHYVDLCEAVAYAHSRGVIHRDIKTENVMLGEFGETVVLDWGLAKVKGKKDIRGREIERELALLQDAGTGKTMDGSAIGTPAYMSPEQADGAIDEIDERSDVWSLGAVLYEILVGRPPFEGVSPFEIIGKVLKDAVVPPQQVLDAVPAELSAVSVKALQREKTARYACAGDLAAEIRAFMAGGRISAYEYSSWELLKAFVARHRTVSALAAIIAVLLIVGAALLWRSNRKVTVERDRAEAAAAEAERQEKRARVQTMQAESNLAYAFDEKARLLFGTSRFLEARVLAAASLVHNPSNPKGPWQVASFGREHTESAVLLGSATSIVCQAEQRALIRSASKIPTELKLYSLDRKNIAWVTDSQWILGSDDGAVQLVDLAGKKLAKLQGSGECAAYAASPAWIVCADEKGGVNIWHADSRTLATRLDPDGTSAGAVSASPDGRWITAAYPSGLVRTWSAPSWKRAWERRVAPGALMGISYAVDSGTLVVKSDERAPKLFVVDAATGRERGMMPVIRFGTRLAVAPASKWVATNGTAHMVVHVYDVESKREVAALPLPDEGSNVDCSPDGGWLASASNDGVLRVWDTRGFELATAVRAHTGPFEARFSPRGDKILTFGSDGFIRLWDVIGDKRRDSVAGDSHVRVMALSGDGKRLATGTMDNVVRVWDPSTGALWRRLEGHTQPLWSMIFGADSTTLISGAFDHQLMIWDLETGRGRSVSTGSGPAADPQLLDGGSKLAVAFVYEPGVALIDLQSGKTIRTFDGDNTVAVSPDERSLVTRDAKRKTRLVVYDLRSGERRLEREANPDMLWVAAYSPDGRWLATGGMAGSLLLWDTSEFGPPRRFEGHSQWINRIVFSADSKLFATTSDDTTARVWDVVTGETLLTLRGSVPLVASRFTPDGRALFVGDNNVVRRYALDCAARDEDPNVVLERAERAASMKLEGFLLRP